MKYTGRKPIYDDVNEFYDTAHKVKKIMDERLRLNKLKRQCFVVVSNPIESTGIYTN